MIWVSKAHESESMLAALCIGQALVFLIGQRGEDTHTVQLVCDIIGAAALQTHTEDGADNVGGIGVNGELVAVTPSRTSCLSRSPI